MNIDPDAPRPFQRHSRKCVCENSKFNVFFDHIEDKTGLSVPDYLVVAPKQAAENMVTGTSILPIVNGRVLLLNIYRYPVNAYSWEIPGGFLDPDEDVHSSVLRELEEETGYSCARENLLSLGYMTPNTGILAARIHLFAALQCNNEKPYIPNEMGHKELRLFDIREVEKMANDSSIQDPCTLVAFYRYKHRP